ncbi:thermonuclease family protein [Paracoccus aeridis]|uniref:thermonuclease family protein n=1 Tax=Paracoccus aeridis TaxID=1966466 RepID=UPI0010AA9AE5|nr:thermonuclease family protein [Paracoccus aeridis]
MITCLAAICLTGAVAIDGDTLRLDAPGKDLRLRLWGISAPELREQGGAAAQDALARLVNGQMLTCDLMDVDRYSRPVVRCALPDGADVACEMVRSGHAADWPRYSRGAYGGCR